MDDLKVVIVDDNPKNRDLIDSFLPEYAKGIKSGFGEDAMRAVCPDNGGRTPDLIVINGEDRKGMSLFLFDWIRNKSRLDSISQVPVVILVDEEFSDKALDFLEIGEATFYEGELEENNFFSIMNEAIESMEFASEPIEPSFTAEKTFERIMGLSVKVKGESDGRKRSAVLDMDKQLENLQAALERGRRKTERIKELMGNASEYKSRKKAEEADNKPVFLNKIREEKGLEPVGGKGSYGAYDEDDIPEEFRLHNDRSSKAEAEDNIGTAIENLNSKIKASPYVAGAAAGIFGGGNNQPSGMTQNGMAGMSMNQSMNAAMGQNMNYGTGYQQNRSGKATIVVVDDEEKELKTCELFLGQKYNVVCLNNGRRAIDYFVRNTADLLLMDTYMPNLGGVQTLNSVRWQVNGRNVPVIFMYDLRNPVAMETLRGEGVIGMIQKPLSAGGLALAVDGFFRNKR